MKVGTKEKKIETKEKECLEEKETRRVGRKGNNIRLARNRPATFSAATREDISTTYSTHTCTETRTTLQAQTTRRESNRHRTLQKRKIRMLSERSPE